MPVSIFGHAPRRSKAESSGACRQPGRRCSAQFDKTSRRRVRERGCQFAGCRAPHRSCCTPNGVQHSGNGRTAPQMGNREHDIRWVRRHSRLSRGRCAADAPTVPDDQVSLRSRRHSHPEGDPRVGPPRQSEWPERHGLREVASDLFVGTDRFSHQLVLSAAHPVDMPGKVDASQQGAA